MNLRVEDWWPVILLLGIPWLWWVSRRTGTDLSRRHLQLATAFRSIVLALLAVALMRPALYRFGSDVSVVYLLDNSHSVAPAAIEDARSWIQRTNDSGKPRESRLVEFGNQEATNIEDAIENALRGFSSHYLKRIVLLSDGHENDGSLMRMVSRLRQAGARVYGFPLQSKSNGDAWVESVTVPAEVSAGEAFPVEVRVYSQVETPGEIELKYGDGNSESRRIHLTAGLNRFDFMPRITGHTGSTIVIATVKAENDPFSENDAARQSVLVGSPGRILYVEGRASSQAYLRDGLEREGLIVAEVQPEALPASAAELDSYDAVIVSDVERRSLTAPQMQAISTYVRDLGGGLILVGGENIYGEGGYSKTLFEDVLPVTFEAKKPPDSVAMIIVLDKSGSMEGQKLAMAKEATKAPLDYLKPTDRFGVVAFDTRLYWALDFQPVVDPQKMKYPISLIPAYGDTNIFPALREAYNRLAGDPAESKHVILLSDGASMPGDFRGITNQMAQAKITVSTIAVGGDADRSLMNNVALWGNGRAYYVQDPSRVPQVFVEEAELATGKSLREAPFQPIVSKETAEIFKGINFQTAPELFGYVTTKRKATAEVLLESPGEDPILARWQYGLGKAVAFTSDARDHWAADWIRWHSYPKFWAQLVRETMRERADDGLDLHVARAGGFANVTITAFEKDGGFHNNMRSVVRVVAPNQSDALFEVPQVAPGRYETSVPLRQRGSYLFRTVAAGHRETSRVLTWSYPDEYRFHPPDLQKLEAFSIETGGVLSPEAKDIFEAGGEMATQPMPLWPYLAALGLAIYLGDVFLRRVRLFESGNSQSD